MRLTVAGVLPVLLGALLVAVPAAPAPAHAPGQRVGSRHVVFEVENTNATSVLCVPDNASYQLRGRLVGPTKDLDGLGRALRVNVLVHDIGTGGWFWNLRSRPAYDYATKLAKSGETTLVLDRLGYGASPLSDGYGTCLGAHADMLHQVVQELRAGQYSYTNPQQGNTPAAAHVVTHGHGVGGAIAELEAATFDDVDGLVLMSWSDTGATPLAARTALQQGEDCLSDDYASFAQTKASFRHIMFASATRAVERAATRRRSQDPCGDVKSLFSLSSGAGLGAAQIDVPVLLLYGAKDRLIRPSARKTQAASYPTKATVRVFSKTGSSLPLEKSASKVRAAVLAWLD